MEGGRSDKHYQVHSGMLASTRSCDENSTVCRHSDLRWRDNPNYGLVITGHSAGRRCSLACSCRAELSRRSVYAASFAQKGERRQEIQHPKITTPFVTSLDSGLPPVRPIHAYAYGVPAVASPDCQRTARGLVTSIIHGHDYVPTLSLAWCATSRTFAHALSMESDSE